MTTSQQKTSHYEAPSLIDGAESYQKATRICTICEGNPGPELVLGAGKASLRGDV